MADIATLGIKVENGDVIKATTSLNSLTVAGGKSEAATQRLTRRMALLEIEARKMDAAAAANASTMARLNAGMGKVGSAVFSMRNAFAALAGALAIRQFATLADTYTNLDSRLRLVTTGTQNLTAVHAALFEQAQRTRTSFEATADLYTRLARNAGALGASQSDLLRVTETINKAMIVSGASASSSQAALIQLGQAFASGVLRGEELNSVLEQAPRLAEAIAAGMGKTVGELRALGKEGKLTATEVFNALQSQGAAIDAEFAQMPRTIGGAMQQIRNEILNTVGSMNDMAGASGGIVVALDGIRGAIGPLARGASAFFGGFAIAASDAAIAVLKIEQAVLKLQAGIAIALRVAGQTKLADWLFGGAAKGLKDGEDMVRLLEKQREALINRVHAIAETGAVSTTATAATTRLAEATGAQAKAVNAAQEALDRYHSALQEKNAEAWNSIQAAKADNAATRELIAATKDGQDAIDAVTIAQAGQNAVKTLGIGVSEKVAAAVRREAEEHARLAIELGKVQQAQSDADRESERQRDEAQRQLERQAKELHRTVSSTIEGILTDIDQHRNPFVAIFDNLKRGAIKAISDILATKIEGKVADILGIQLPATKQEHAGILMNTAADKMLQAAGHMNGTPGITIPRSEGTSGATQRYLQQFLKVGGAAYGGYQTGYGIGQMTGDKASGAIGGAVSGAMLGAQIGGPVGAAVGGIAGLVGGIIGAGDAARKARERMEELRKAFQNTFDALKAELNKDTLGQAVAQVKSQYDAARQQLKDAMTLTDLWTREGQKRYLEQIAALGTLDEMEAKRIEQLKQEAALIKQQAQEDLDVRTLRNQGRTRDAEILQKQHEDQRELAKAIEAGMSDAYLAQLRQNQAMEEAAVAAGKAADAINGLATSMRNAPSGFKLEGYIQQYARGAPFPGSVPLNPLSPSPFAPPRTPLGAPPTLSRTSASPASVTVTGGITVNITESKNPQETAKVVVREIRRYGASLNGLNGNTSDALNTFPA